VGVGMCLPMAIGAEAQPQNPTNHTVGLHLTVVGTEKAIESCRSACFGLKQAGFGPKQAQF